MFFMLYDFVAMPYVFNEYRKCFRDLTEEELKLTLHAMRFLVKKKIEVERIVKLNKYQINREEKTIKFVYHYNKFVINRYVNYKNSPLEKQIESMGELRTIYRVFPKGVWSKRKTDVFSVPIFSEEEVRKMLGLPLKKVKRKLLTKKNKRLIINLSI